MKYYNVFTDFPYGVFFESLMPDFIISFIFFTALVYAVLCRRFDHQRSAAAMSGSLGLALSAGLVWWEYQRGWSIRDLGGISIGFVVILLAMIMFQAIKQTGGNWAGAGIALGAGILAAWVLGLPPPASHQIIQVIAAAALTVGVLAFLLHSHGLTRPSAQISRMSPPQDTEAGTRHDMINLYDDSKAGKRLEARFNELVDYAGNVKRYPRYAADMMDKINSILPEQGRLTYRLSRLRERMHLIKKGRIKQIEELKGILRKTPMSKRAELKNKIHTYLKELGFDKRLERLDRAVAETETRIRQLTVNARDCLVKKDYSALECTLKKAKKLQQHNDRLLKTITRTEKKLSTMTSRLADKINPGGTNEN
jgi:hypothetical protein